MYLNPGLILTGFLVIYFGKFGGLRKVGSIYGKKDAL
jgi:hypothetical protein